DCEEVTPVPIPNTAVKLFSADGSWGVAPARVGRRQAIKKAFHRWDAFFIFYMYHFSINKIVEQQEMYRITFSSLKDVIVVVLSQSLMNKVSECCFDFSHA